MAAPAPQGGELFVLGLVGDVCAGKSSVARLLADCGALIWNADEAVAEIYRTKDMQAFVRGEFGPGVFDAQGAVNRRALGQAVFADPVKLQVLTEAVFARTGPKIEAAIQAARDRARASASGVGTAGSVGGGEGGGRTVLVLDAPTLFESGRADRCDAVAFVAAPAEWKEQRAIRDRGWPAGEVALRESRLMDRRVKLAQCRFVIDNGASWDHLHAQVAAMWRELHHGKA
ncbi:MAG: dephospho-CoA kinase [Planctomycetota bacterium]